MKCSQCGADFESDNPRHRKCESCRFKRSEYMRKRWASLPEDKRQKALAGMRSYGRENRGSDRKRGVKANAKLRRQIVEAYGGKCTCCGETEWKFLTLHHQNGDGGKHREELNIKAGNTYYVQLRRLGFPQDMGLELMCFNCHMADRMEGGCPHKVAG